MSDTPATDNLSELRKRADQAAQLERTNAEMARKIAFMEAGIDYTKGTGKLLFDSYQGDPSKEAVTTTALEYGISLEGSPATPPPPAPPTVDPSFAAHRQSLTSDGTPAGAPPERVRTDPYETALLNKQAGLRAGRESDQLLAEGVAAVMGAAALGDQRVTVTPNRTGYEDPRNRR